MDASNDSLVGMSFFPVRLMATEIDGNAFSLLGAFAAQARHQGWSEDAIAEVQDEAMKGDYAHLTRTLAKYVEHPSDTGA